MIGQRPPRNQSHHHKTRDCGPRGRAVLLGSLILLLSTWGPFPIKSLALSAHVSRTIHFWVLDKSPVSGPGRGPPSCNTRRIHICFLCFQWNLCSQRSTENESIFKVCMSWTNRTLPPTFFSVISVHLIQVCLLRLRFMQSCNLIMTQLFPSIAWLSCQEWRQRLKRCKECLLKT